MIKCDYCGADIYRTEYRLGLNKHQFCTPECSTKYRAKESREIRICILCGKGFECVKHKRQRYCSKKCGDTGMGLNNRGKNHPNFNSVEKQCACCNNTFLAVKAKEHSAKYCSRKCQRTYLKNELYSSSEWSKMRSMIAANYISNIKSKETKPHRIISEALSDEYVLTNEKNFKYYSVDIFLEEFNAPIEIQGDFWHCNPIKYSCAKYTQQQKAIRRDRAKNTYLREYHNMNILYLWETDVNSDLHKCKLLVDAYVVSNGNLPNYNSFNYSVCDGTLSLNDVIINSYQGT